MQSYTRLYDVPTKHVCLHLQWGLDAMVSAVMENKPVKFNTAPWCFERQRMRPGKLTFSA